MFVNNIYSDQIKKALLDLLLRMADTSLVLGHRLSEWCGHGFILEQDIAISNIALDHMGQAQNWYLLAAQLQDENKSADDLAFLRDVLEYRNLLIVEQPNADFAHTLIRQFLFDVFQFNLLTSLSQSTDSNIAGIAEKSLKEASYHVKWSSEWVVRLGDGTKESNERVQKALNNLWEYTGEMFLPNTTDTLLSELGLGADLNAIKSNWETYVEGVLKEATLTIPTKKWMQKGGKDGVHTEHLGLLLSEMQFMQRAYPNCQW
jgi:ring-1,2-phenylacetyl-CoA epoxidase subunit PaaC